MIPDRFPLRFPAGLVLLAVLQASCASVYYPAAVKPSGLPPPRASATLAALRDPHGPPLVIAHRGGRAWAPENTIQGVLAAWRMGVPMVEVDVRSTSDGVPVLLHDSSLARTAGVGERVGAIPLSEVKKAEIPFRRGSAPLRVPTLAEAVRAARGKVVLVLDLKQVETDRLLAVLEGEHALGEVLILAHKKRQMEELARSGVRKRILLAVRAAGAAQALDFQRAFHPEVVHVSPGFLSPRLGRTLRDRGSRVWVNAFSGPDRTGKKEDYLALIRQGADILQTDRPVLALRALAELPALVESGAPPSPGSLPAGKGGILVVTSSPGSSPSSCPRGWGRSRPSMRPAEARTGWFPSPSGSGG